MDPTALSDAAPQAGYWREGTLCISWKGPEGEASTTIQKPFARVGSHPGADVRLTAEGVPLLAVYLHATEQGVFFVRLGESGGVEGPGRGWLAPDRAIRVGPYALRAETSPAATERPGDRADLQADGSAALPAPTLAISAQGKEVAQQQIRRRLTLVGHRSPSTLRIVAPNVAGCHLALFWDPPQLWAIDLLSSSGTRHEGRAIDAVALASGAAIDMGAVRLMRSQDVSRPTVEETKSRNEKLKTQEKALAAQQAQFEQVRQSWEQSKSQQEAELGRMRDELAADREALKAERDPTRGESSKEIDQLREREEALERERDELREEKRRWEEAQTKWEVQRQQEKQNRESREADFRAAEELLQSRREALENEQLQWEETRERRDAEAAARERDLKRRTEQIDAERKAIDSERAEWDEYLRDAEGRLAVGREQLAAERKQLKADWRDLQSARAELGERSTTADLSPAAHPEPSPPPRPEPPSQRDEAVAPVRRPAPRAPREQPPWEHRAAQLLAEKDPTAREIEFDDIRSRVTSELATLKPDRTKNMIIGGVAVVLLLATAAVLSYGYFFGGPKTPPSSAPPQVEGRERPTFSLDPLTE